MEEVIADSYMQSIAVSPSKKLLFIFCFRSVITSYNQSNFQHYRQPTTCSCDQIQVRQSLPARGFFGYQPFPPKILFVNVQMITFARSLGEKGVILDTFTYSIEKEKELHVHQYNKFGVQLCRHF